MNWRPTSWKTLLCLIIAGNCSLARGENGISSPVGSPPRVVAMPDDYQRAWCASSECGFGLANAAVLQGGEWAVAELKRFDNPKTLVAGPCGTFPGRAVSVGWLAIELDSRESVFLQPPEDRRLPKDVMLGRAGFHDRLLLWRTGCCAVGIQIASEDRVRNATPQSRIDRLGMEAVYPGAERWFLWEWHPKEGIVKPLDWFAPVDSLVGALVGTPYRVRSWNPPSLGSSWSGQIQLRNTQTGHEWVLAIPEPAKVIGRRDSFTESHEGRLDFAVTDSPNTVVVLDRLGVDRDGAVLSAVDLTRDSHVRWQVTREAFDRLLKTGLGEIYLIRGTARPCSALPLIVLSNRDEDDLSQPLWLLETQTGKLTGPLELPWKFKGSLFGFSAEGQSLCASQDGRLLTYLTDNAFDSEPPRIVVYDIQSRKILASREASSDDVQPVGFDAKGNVILASSNGVFRWRPPFAGPWESIFALK